MNCTGKCDFMKKLFFLFCSLAIPATLIFAQTKNEELDRKRIVSNKVKQITQWSHRYAQDKPNPKGYKASETKYDKKGNPIEIINYKANGDISSKVLYKYNDKNQRIEYVLYQKLNRPEIEIANKQTYLYDSKGNKSLEVRFDGQTQSRVVYEYHPDNKPKGIVTYSASNKVLEKWDYAYEGGYQNITITDGDNKLTSSIKRKNDDKGNLLEEIRFDSKGKELKRIVSAYGSNGYLTEEIEYYTGNLVKKQYFKYSNQGILIEILQENPDGTKFTQSTYKHDTKGNLMEERWSEGDPNEFSHKQSSYDKNGNPLEVDSYYAPYKFRVLYKYSYDYY
jgi:hypothetical protein